MDGFPVALVLAEDKVLGCAHRLAAHVVRVHALPASRYGAAVENHHQPVVVRVAEYGFVERHRLLLVAAEEVHLDALHAYALEPAHLLLAGNGAAHYVGRALGDVVPPAAGGIPEEEVHVFRPCVARELLHPLPAYVGVPEIVYEAVAEAHCGGEVYVLHLVVVVDAGVLPEYPAPGSLAESVAVAAFVARLHHVEGYGGLDYGCEVGANGDGAPGCAARKREGRLGGAVAVVLLRHRELYAVALSLAVFAQSGAAVPAVHAGLADQGPACARNLEKAGEGVAVAEFGLLVHQGTRLVVFFVARLGAFPAHHRVALRAEVGGGAGREVEGGLLTHHPDAACPVVLEDIVAEGDIIVADVPFYVERVAVRGLAVEQGSAGIALHAALLDAVEAVVDPDVLRLCGLEGKLAEIAEVARQAEGGRGEEGLSVIFDAVKQAGVFALLNLDEQSPVGAAEACDQSQQERE